MNRPRAVDATARIAKTRVFMVSSFVHLAVCKRRKSRSYREAKGYVMYSARLAAIPSFETAAAPHAYGAENTRHQADRIMLEVIRVYARRMRVMDKMHLNTHSQKELARQDY
jgi:hypothetical protein